MASCKQKRVFLLSLPFVNIASVANDFFFSLSDRCMPRFLDE
jgi:hypothetical protein